MTALLEVNHDHDAITHLLSGTPWVLQPGFRYDDLEGFKDGVFGYRSGPARNIQSLYHEISHVLEFALNDPDRLDSSGYRFRLPEDFVFGQFVCEPVTTQPIERELRTLGIQLCIMESNPLLDFDRDHFLDFWSSALRHMPDWCLISYFHLSPKNGTDYEGVKAARIQWCRDQIQAEARRHTADNLAQVWASRALPALL